MPFYDYKCNKCSKSFEVIHGMSGMPKGLKCEFCGSPDLQRVFHPVGTMKSGGSCSSCASGSCGSCH